MNCFIGLILIANVYLNPCSISSMTPDYYDATDSNPTSCTVEFNNGGEQTLEVTCEQIQSKLEDKRKYER